MKNKKGKILIILGIVLIVLIVAICMAKNVFLSTRTLFYKYLISGNIENVTDIDYDEFLESAKQVDGAPARNYGTIDIEGDVKSSKGLLTSTGNISGISIDYDIQTGNNNKDQYINLKANYNNTEIINLEVLKNNFVVGMKESDFIDKYIAIDLNKSSETLEELNIDGSANFNISPGYSPYNLFYVSKEDRQTIINTYKDVIFKTIPKKNYTKEKSQQIEVNGNQYKCNVYKLTMTEEELNKLYVNVLEELKNDELTLNLLLEKYKMLNDNDNDYTIEEMKKQIQKEIDTISKKRPKDSEISIVVYENNSKTVRTEFIKDKDKVCVDVTKNKTGITVLLKEEIDGDKIEMLFNSDKSSETESNYKIIYKTGGDNIKLDIRNKYDKNPTMQIETIGEENSYNLTEMTHDEREEIYNQLTNSVNSFIVKKMQKLGIPSQLFMNTTDDENLLNEEAEQENNENTWNNDEDTWNNDENSGGNIEEDVSGDDEVPNPLQSMNL